MAQNVRFISVKLQETYDALAVKDSLALYWIQETQRLYKGDKLYGNGMLATEQAAGLLSPEDYTALKSLIASGCGISNLTAVDGTIVLTDVANGGKNISVAIAQNENNALVAVDGGLFVPTVIVPEYSIEKQETADAGFSASYKLKKTVNGVISYVGDTINIAKDLVLKSATLETVVEANVPYDGAVVGDPYICMVFNDVNASNLYIPVKGLVDKFSAGAGISIENNVISVKIAENSHGLVAVDGAMSISLATRKSDGAMSKEDKLKLDSIPSAYVARKFEVSDTPVGTIVDYRDHEIRVMCPTDANYVKQSVGVGGDPNTYYITFKTYAPSDDSVGYIEHLNGQSDSEILTKFNVDEYGRRYQPTWLGVAKFDEATNTWNYYGKNSSTEKYIGWDYQIDWYNANGIRIASDSIRINLSNEDCHMVITPYYISALEAKVESVCESYTWGEI